MESGSTPTPAPMSPSNATAVPTNTAPQMQTPVLSPSAVTTAPPPATAPIAIAPVVNLTTELAQPVVGGDKISSTGSTGSSESSAGSGNQYSLRDSSTPRRRQRYMQDDERLDVIRRVLNGERQSDLAREYQVTRAAICNTFKNRNDILRRAQQQQLPPVPPNLVVPKVNAAPPPESSSPCVAGSRHCPPVSEDCAVDSGQCATRRDIGIVSSSGSSRGRSSGSDNNNSLPSSSSSSSGGRSSSSTRIVTTNVPPTFASLPSEQPRFVRHGETFK